MGNESSTLLKLRRASKEKEEKQIIRCESQDAPLYRKRSKRSVSVSRYAAERSRTPPEENCPPTSNERKNSGGNSLAPAAIGDRRRSRSLCGAQMEADAQVVASSTPITTPREEKKEGRKSSNSGLVPALNRLRIQQCYKTAKPSIGASVLRRAAASRPELKNMFAKLNEEQFDDIARQMYSLITDAVQNIDRADEVLSHGRSFGETFASLCPFGFRPDLFSPIADAAIAECVKLDGGVHKRCETLLAWSQLVAALFTSVRDGYYERVRYQRRSSLPQHSLSKQLSMDVSARSIDHQDSRESIRP